MKSGKITDARDQVLRTFRSFRLFMSWTLASSRGWTNGPFLTDRDISGSFARTCDAGCARSGDWSPSRAASGTPRRLRGHARRGLALATTVRVIPRGHRDTADLRTLAHVARAAGLAEVLVLMIQVADLADGRDAAERHAAHLARREPDGGEVALLREELGRRAGGPDDLAALAGDELDVVDGGAQRDVGQGQGVADAGLGPRSGDDDVPDLE